MGRCADAKIILDFFEGRLRNSDGVTLSDVVEFSNFELETDHNYIQWLFPNRRQSRINPDAPLLTSEAIDAMQASSDAIDAFLKGLQMMVSFYDRNGHWLCRSDHNHLRITRIIEAVAAILGKEEAKRFLAFLLDKNISAASPISPKVIGIWQNRLSDDPR